MPRSGDRRGEQTGAGPASAGEGSPEADPSVYSSWLTAAERGQARLMALQEADGRWEGEVVWCPVITAMVVLAYTVMGRPITAEKAQLITRYFAATRRQDGGWGLHPESHSYLFVTTLVYVASRLLGQQLNSPLLAPAAVWLTNHPEGLGALPTWGRFWLSLLGLYDRGRVTVCPPEFFLLPAWFPLAPDRLYCHTRYIYLGMAYLTGVGLRVDLGVLGHTLRTELAGFTRPGPQPRHRIAATDLYLPPGRGLRLTYDLMAALGPIWSRLPAAAPLRRRALDRCLRRIRAEQTASRFQALSPVNGVLNTIALWTHDPLAPETEASIAGLETWCWRDETEGVRYAGARSATWDTAFALQALVSGAPTIPDHAAAVSAGYEALKRFQVQGAPDRSPRTPIATGLNTMAPLDEGRQDPRGGWCFGQPAHGWPVSDCTAEALSALLLCHCRPDRVTPEDGSADDKIAADCIAAAIRFLLARQNRDGGFGTYERRRAGKRVERLNPSEMFGSCMTEGSYIECTASAIRALRHAREVPLPEPLSGECVVAMARARDFLLRRQRRDGAWPGFWGINFIYATGFAVAALRDSGLPSDHPAVRRAIAWIQHAQQPDGGWGEHFSGCLTGTYVPNAGSLVISTAWAVLGLLRAADGVSPAAQNGLDWLVARQLPNGDWPRDSVNGVFFGTAMLDYRLYNTYFPVWALCLACAAVPAADAP